ncbi:MAG: T9SS type A sorting domain-containing protein [Lentimicrobium sp.]|nr:T9SS type A sorting domain-containing protein [Lentimicrobium sp.]
MLTGTYGWTITDGGESNPTAVNSLVAESINVYPNPFQNSFHISNAANASQLIITNIVGKVVMTVNLSRSSNQVIETNLPSGLYLITIVANDGSIAVRKMISE